jgi:hypothetical protein
VKSRGLRVRRGTPKESSKGLLIGEGLRRRRAGPGDGERGAGAARRGWRVRTGSSSFQSGLGARRVRRGGGEARRRGGGGEVEREGARWRGAGRRSASRSRRRGGEGGSETRIRLIAPLRSLSRFSSRQDSTRSAGRSRSVGRRVRALEIDCEGRKDCCGRRAICMLDSSSLPSKTRRRLVFEVLVGSAQGF